MHERSPQFVKQKRIGRTDRYRLATIVALCFLFAAFAVMISTLPSQLRLLSRAQGDNMQWSIVQLDSEFANLDAALFRVLAQDEIDESHIKLRIDIALSRLKVVTSGRASTLFEQNAKAERCIALIVEYAERAIEIVDQSPPLTRANVVTLQEMTQNIRPEARRLALLGVSLSASRSDISRRAFERTLFFTGGLTLVLLGLMGALTFVFDRMVTRADKRDVELLHSTQQLRSTVSASLDAIVTADRDGIILGFNAAAEDVFGWTREEAVGQEMNDMIILPHHHDAQNAAAKRFFASGESRIVDAGLVELTALRKTGEEFPIEVNITSTELSSGAQFIAYIRDISTRKINEQRLIDARDQAQRTDKAKSQFMTVMSHEMRTPLNGILGVLDLLKTTGLDDKQMRYAKIATASGEILLDHVNEALDITRVEAGSLPLAEITFHLDDLVRSTIDVLEPLAGEKGLELRASISSTARTALRGDGNRVRQILTNLIGNAIKFTETGRIDVSASSVHGPKLSDLRIVVQDTGPGIPESEQESIFEDFVALGTGKDSLTRGDGLGLSISRRIAREMGGNLSVTSAEGKGARFTFSVPMLRPSEVDAVITPPSAEALAIRSLDILIVEDNVVNRRVLAEMLEGLGHRVSEAVNGVEALSMAAEETFDLVFMDISMPEMDGIEATRQLRKLPGPNRETQIVGLTAHGQEEYRENAEQAGMNGFETKPIRLAGLQRLVSGSTLADKNLAAAPAHVLHELCHALGVGTVRASGAKLFDEVEALFDAAGGAELPARSQALALEIHKTKGAAALFGLQGLVAALEQLEEIAPTAELAELQANLVRIIPAKDAAYGEFRDVLNSLPQTS